MKNILQNLIIQKDNNIRSVCNTIRSNKEYSNLLNDLNNFTSLYTVMNR